FRKNAARHVACSISHPPITGPIAAVIEVNADHVPIARPPFFSSNDAPIIDRLPGTTSAPPTPFKGPATIRCATVAESPHAIEDTAKTVTPAAKIARLPYRSPREPPTSSKAASKSA